MARIWPWYSLRGLHIRMTWVSLYGIHITWFTLYGNGNISLGLPYMVMHWMRRCYGLLWTLHYPRGRYCDVTVLWPFLFYGIRADLSGTHSNVRLYVYTLSTRYDQANIPREVSGRGRQSIPIISYLLTGDLHVFHNYSHELVVTVTREFFYSFSLYISAIISVCQRWLVETRVPIWNVRNIRYQYIKSTRLLQWNKLCAPS